jgi:hypothetical protein
MSIVDKDTVNHLADQVATQHNANRRAMIIQHWINDRTSSATKYIHDILYGEGLGDEAVRQELAAWCTTHSHDVALLLGEVLREMLTKELLPKREAQS